MTWYQKWCPLTPTNRWCWSPMTCNDGIITEERWCVQLLQTDPWYSTDPDWLGSLQLTSHWWSRRTGTLFVFERNVSIEWYNYLNSLLNSWSKCKVATFIILEEKINKWVKTESFGKTSLNSTKLLKTNMTLRNYSTFVKILLAVSLQLIFIIEWLLLNNLKKYF